jgi:PAS domain-containing protein
VAARSHALQTQQLERKAEQPQADATRLLGECVRELKHTFEFLEAAGERLADADEDLKKARAPSFTNRIASDPSSICCRMPSSRQTLPGVIVTGNAAAGRLLNVSPRALVGRPLHMFLNGERVEFIQFIKAVPETQEIAERQIHLRPRERHFVKVTARVGIVRDPEGRPSAMHWLLRRAESDQHIALPSDGMSTSVLNSPD